MSWSAFLIPIPESTTKKNNSILLKGLGKRYSYQNSCLVFNCENCLNVYGPATDFNIDGLTFVNLLSQANYTTKLINVPTNDGYLARCTFKNLNVANFSEAFNLLTPSASIDYNDGIIFENVQFRTVGKCITAKHFEAAKVSNCYTEPLTN